MEVGIKLEPTLTAEELGLRTTVASVGKPAYGASLARVPGVNGDHLAAERLGLVFQEALELGEAPRVKPAFGFAAPGFDTASNVGEVLNHDSRAGFNAFEDRGRENVVAIPSETLFASSEASKVPFGALRTVGLQGTFEAEGTLDDFLHVSVAMKAVVRGHGRPGNSEVNPDSLAVAGERNLGQLHNNVEIETALTEQKVSRSRRTAHHILGIVGEIKRNLYSALRGRQVHDSPLPIQSEGMQVVSRWAKQGLWASRSQPLLLSGDSGLHRFGSLLSGLNVKVGNKTRQGSFTITVSQEMKGVGIAVVLFPSRAADAIERLGELLHRFMQNFRLFLRRLEGYANRSIHSWIIPYGDYNLQQEISADSSAS